MIKRHARRLGMDTSHFTGQRRWSDAQLRRAAASACSWPELLSDLGLASDSGSDRLRVKGHAKRLDLDLSRFDIPQGKPAVPAFRPDIRHLKEAGPAIAAAWFLICGYNVSIPMEPAVYDLLVSMPGGISRVQVKTTTYSNKGWTVQVGRRPYAAGSTGRLVPYDPDLVDFFFIVDGDLTMYVIPSSAIAGRVYIVLNSYTDYAVGSAAFLISRAAAAA